MRKGGGINKGDAKRMYKPSDKRYTVEIFQNGIYVQYITNYAPSPNSARSKALKMFKEDNKDSKGITAITK